VAPGSRALRGKHYLFAEILLRLVMRRWKAAQNAHVYAMHSAFFAVFRAA